MTERFEVTTDLQRVLVNDPATFGEIVKGTPADPAVYMESVHHLMKAVAGAPNIRPTWFFDTHEQGEAASDIGTHLVDLVQWTLFPDHAIDYKADVKMLAAQRWPTWIPEADFRRVTNTPGFPRNWPQASRMAGSSTYCNTLVSYTLKGVHTKLNIIWDWEAPAGGRATRTSRSTGARARGSKFARPRPIATCPSLRRPGGRGEGGSARGCSGEDQERLGDVSRCRRRGSRNRIKVTVPDALRVGHEAHFAQVASSFLKYIRDRSALPAWERPNMLAKYSPRPPAPNSAGRAPRSRPTASRRADYAHR